MVESSKILSKGATSAPVTIKEMLVKTCVVMSQYTSLVVSSTN